MISVNASATLTIHILSIILAIIMDGTSTLGKMPAAYLTRHPSAL
jgi:hypothetical protein